MGETDLISRQAAIKILRESEEYDADIPNRADGVRDAIIDIMSLPTIEERKGKWIDVDDSNNTISGRCSLCGWEAHLYEDDVVGMNYCPNCGADMRKNNA